MQGGNGGHVVNSGEGSVTGNFRWVQIVADANFSSITDETMENVADLQGFDHIAGTGFGGNITELTVASGTVIAYNQ